MSMSRYLIFWKENRTRRHSVLQWVCWSRNTFYVFMIMSGIRRSAFSVLAFHTAFFIIQGDHLIGSA